MYKLVFSWPIAGLGVSIFYLGSIQSLVELQIAFGPLNYSDNIVIKNIKGGLLLLYRSDIICYLRPWIKVKQLPFDRGRRGKVSEAWDALWIHFIYQSI